MHGYYCTEFEEWKCNFEEEQDSYYCKISGTKYQEKIGLETSYFYCNRSGNYSAKGKGLRRVKTQGSCKINGHCTSMILLNKFTDTNECEVEVFKTHYGHEMQLGHLRLSKKDRITIARKRQIGVEPERILKDIQENLGKKLITELLSILDTHITGFVNFGLGS